MYEGSVKLYVLVFIINNIIQHYLKYALESSFNLVLFTKIKITFLRLADSENLANLAWKLQNMSKEKFKSLYIQIKFMFIILITAML